eukprot:2062830-Rhodomonas_salina.1
MMCGRTAALLLVLIAAAVVFAKDEPAGFTTQVAAARQKSVTNPWIKFSASQPSPGASRALRIALGRGLGVSIRVLTWGLAVCLSPFTIIEKMREGGKRARSADNISVDGPRGSLTAIQVLVFRAMGARAGFNPDHVAPALAANVADSITLQMATGGSLMPDFWGSRVLTRFYMNALVAAFKLSGRWVDFTTGHGTGSAISWVYLHHSRTCFFDDVWLAFCAEHKEHSSLCILGAGYDSRCYRLQQPGATLWEVDAPSSQREKRRVLGKSGVPSKAIEAVTFVECDFSSESFAEKLQQHAFPRDVPACFLWEGVTYYLEKARVLATLKQVAALGASGSVIALDYFQPAHSSRTQTQYTAKAKRLGEAQVGFITKEELAALMGEAGLRVVDHMSKNEGARYFEPLDLDLGAAGANYIGYLVAQVP